MHNVALILTVLCSRVPVQTLIPHPFTPMSSAYDEAVQVHDGLIRRLKDFQEHSIPNLRDCKGPLAFQQQLAAEIRDDMDIFNRELQVRAIWICHFGLQR